ncbi:MAG: endonuclease/exonuclease/phosphatase family protein [Lachnospiraceae bacterium]|nr:endonuclease/exonuclease/phosphatase family protein [Lachnospiraceae bacterium]
MWKKILKSLLVVLLVLVLVVLGYVGYVFGTYSRIEDNLELNVTHNSLMDPCQTNTEYTIFTQNLGFGAYTADFTFFMDGGDDSVAESAESVKNCTNAACSVTSQFHPDFIFYQEVDVDGDRSKHVNQTAILKEFFSSYDEVFACNYHSAYLFYPVTDPIGQATSGIETFSRYPISSSLRRSFPITTGFGKVVDLDRCYSITHVPVNNGKELVLFNLHSSAYAGSPEIRTAQMTKLFNDMKEQKDLGNYVICGGDWNHDFTCSSVEYFNGIKDVEYGWCQPFPDSMIPEGFEKQIAYDTQELVSTTRNTNIPYGEDSFLAILDGFITSDNITVTSLQNYDTAYAYTDHNPVIMTFVLED